MTKGIAATGLGFVLAAALAGCSPQAPASTPEAPGAVSEGAGEAPAPSPEQAPVTAIRQEIGKSPLPRTAMPGERFKPYFPPSSRVDTLKIRSVDAGMARAVLAKGSTVFANLSIQDAARNSGIRARFSPLRNAIAGFPAVVGPGPVSAVLVADRYVVEVRAEGKKDDPVDREATLGRFDLMGLGELK